MQPPDSGREAHWLSRLNEPSWVLDPGARLLMLQVMLGVCEHRRWIAHGIHIRTTHVHAVVGGEAAPERMLRDFKAYATRAFRSIGAGSHRRRYWTAHGSTRYLWNEASRTAAIEYVLNGQGLKMACYPESASH